jgi:hypothetical protein
MRAPITSEMDGAQTLNESCLCRTLNQDLLRQQLDHEVGVPGMWQGIVASRPHLFSSAAVFLTASMAQQLTQAASALERVMNMEPYREAALARAPAIAQHAFGPHGVFMGYDFHLGPQGPRLIEINTNAGGGLLNAVLARANHACCQRMNWAVQAEPPSATLEAEYLNMFLSEWRSQRGDRPLRHIAIVDDQPDQQYLAPEFTLFQRFFERHGLIADIVGAPALQYRDGKLMHQGQSIDMVYNRLTDFDLSEPSHAALKQAYAEGSVVLTPHPHVHAVKSDKHNLVLLSNDVLLARWGVLASDRQTLQAVVPRTVAVTSPLADELWAQRKQWFFKPAAGYGAKGAYRGDKLTRRVWADILGGSYVAQAFVPPSMRIVHVDGEPAGLKFDLRAYAYDGHIQLMAARMYSGQTTNFRTPGGGFAPVMVLP